MTAKLYLMAVPEANVGAFQLTAHGKVFEGRVQVYGMDADPFTLELAALVMSRGLVEQFQLEGELAVYSENTQLMDTLAVGIAEVEREGEHVH